MYSSEKSSTANDKQATVQNRNSLIIRNLHNTFNIICHFNNSICRTFYSLLRCPLNPSSL